MRCVESNEENEQIALFQWAEFAAVRYPELELMYHVPNEGKRSVRTGSRLKKAGLKSGYCSSGSKRRIYRIVHRIEIRQKQSY